MTNKNTIYESSKLHGIYRCGKRSDFFAKVPKMEHDDIPDMTGLVLSGMWNYGADEALIRTLIAEALQCDADALKIPFDERTQARNRFISAMLFGKLKGILTSSVKDLVSTFYSFMEMPTKATMEQQVEEDTRNINRYLHCETRTPKNIGNPIVRIGGTAFSCQMDFMFLYPQTIQSNKRKEGRKWVYDQEEVLVAEAVRVFPGKPVVKATSKVLDAGVSNRLELYIMVKAMEQFMKTNHASELRRVVLRGSYYYLQKDRETPDKYSPDFFDKKGGNIVSLTVWMDGMTDVDAAYQTQLELFLKGQSVLPEKCKDCSARFLCNYHETDKPLPETPISAAKTLPVLSADQEKAANALSGNIRVIATAGSGKTTTMAYRILNLLKSGAKPETIGCFTFTNAGAGEMASRIKVFCELAGIEHADEVVDAMTISTLHAFGDTILKKYYQTLGFTKPPVLINEVQKTKIIERILSEHEPIEELYDKYKNFYMDMFKAKGILELMKDYFTNLMEGMTVTELQAKTGLNDISMQAILSMYQDYTAYKKQECLIEHADQELGVLRLLQIKPDIFDEIGLQHISVDEYQDTSNVQFAIIQAMRNAHGVQSLFIVGDDDQSIYGFRDANVELIQNFFEMIGDTHGHDIKLMENRRSTQNIVNFAADLIRNNEYRVDKHPVSTNELGKPVDVVAFQDKEAEQDYIITTIENLLAKGTADSDIAILTPTNAELLQFADILQKKGIPCVSINPEPLLDNIHVHAAISYVRYLLMHNEFDAVNYLNVKEAGSTVGLENTAVKSLVEQLAEEQTHIKTVSDLFTVFSCLDENAEDEIYQAFLDDVKTAEETAVQQENLPKVCEYILDFERFGKKQTARKEKAYHGVVLSTMHSSKGKEWPIVFCSVTKLHTREMKEEDIPEKNRLLFVSCTRAKKELYVSGVLKVAGWGSSSSDTDNLFLQECLEARYGQDVNIA